MKKIYLLLLSIILFCAGSFAQVSVTATAGTTGPTSYTTLKGAFDAINAGTHQGAIIIEISANTTEGTTPATLNSTGAGAAIYTSVLIRPIADGVSISGNPITGFGVIQLKGADNVTIDGDNPNTSGTNRNLTIANTTTNTVIANSVIRIATAATNVTSADNNTIKNCILNGNVTSGNLSTITSTSGSSNSSFGIYVGGNGGSTATDAPTAITSVSSQIIPAATTVNNLIIDNNSINQAARAIEFNGASITNSNGVTITKNDIGNSIAGAVTGVYSMAITVQGSSLVSISGNTLYVESYVGTSVRGIDIGSISANVSGVTIEKNKVGRVWGNSISGFGAYGINYQGGNSGVFQNNFIYNINAFLNNGSISATFGPHGLRIASGTSHKIYHNSINLYGAVIGSSAVSMVSALTITSSTVTGLDIRNNILANTITGSPAGTPVDCIALPSGLTSTFNLITNNNFYYSSSQLGQSGTSSVSIFTIVGFNASSTSGAANWRSYSSSLLAANTNNDIASLASTSAAPFTSSTDLHINTGVTPTQLESGGATVGVTVDIDANVRPGPAGSVNGGATAADIGADEFDGVPLDLSGPTIAYTPLTFTCAPGNRTLNTTITDGSGVPTSGVGLPVLYWKVNAGAYSAVQGVSMGSNQYTFTFGGSAVTGDVISYYIVAQDNAATPNISVSPSAGAGGVTANPPAAITSPTTPNTYSISAPLNGNYTIGAGGDYLTLTAAINAYNNSCLSGPVLFRLTDANYTGETFPITILNNPNANATNTLTIQPAFGVAVALSGASATSAIIKLNGADYVTIDGVNSGGSSLAITNTSATATSVVFWIGSASATDSATNNSIKNCAISGASGTTTVAGVLAGSGSAFGSPAESSNSNNSIIGNTIKKTQNGIYAFGSTNLDQNWVINDNILGSSLAAEKHSFRGLLIANAQNFSISNNTISGVVSSTTSSSTMSGIQVAGLINGGTISKNKISDIKQVNTAGWGSNAILLGASTINSNILISNNIISDVASYGFADVTVADNGYGIIAASGGGYNIYFNTINLNTNQTATTGIPSAINITSSITTAGAINLRNNIISSTQTIGTDRYAIYVAAANTVFGSIDYNIYTTAGPNLGYLGSSRANITAWRTASGSDKGSMSAVVPFVSATDLHIDNTSLDSWNVNGRGIAITAVATDIDGNTRSILLGTPTDIGADEFTTATVPNDATASSAPAASTTTSYISAGRKIADITWGAGGTPPTSISFKYYPGVPPSGSPFSSINSYSNVAATGGTGFTYDIKYYYTDAEANGIPDISLSGQKNDLGTWYAVGGTQGTDADGKFINITNLNGFSLFSLKAAGALPVRFISFVGNKKTTSVELKWQVSEQQGIMKYVVERSADGRTFSDIGTANATIVQNNYSFTDVQPIQGNNFYRLRIIENARVTYSSVVLISYNGKESIVVFPVPAKDQVTLQTSKQSLMNTEASIINAEGKIVLRFVLSQSVQSVNISSLAPGIYFLKTADGTTSRLVKQ